VTAEATTPSRGRRSRWLLPVGTFLVGLAVGIIIVGLLSSGTRDFPSATGPTVTPMTTASQPSPAASPTAGAAEARVNAACLRVISEAQQVYNIIAGVGEAADDVDLQRLDDMVRQLQPIEPLLKRDLEACNVDTKVERNPGASPASPSPTDPQTTASPTR
jgi:hypothetical protein